MSAPHATEFDGGAEQNRTRLLVRSLLSSQHFTSTFTIRCYKVLPRAAVCCNQVLQTFLAATCRIAIFDVLAPLTCPLSRRNSDPSWMSP
jgi:hypothetical protein